MKKFVSRITDIFIAIFLIWIVSSTINVCQYNNYEGESENIWKYNAYNLLIVEQEG